jgi:hypothetical protein
MSLTAFSSHPDWRDVPLLTAISFGVSSVEADVWLVNETLFVSSTRRVLTYSDFACP